MRSNTANTQHSRKLGRRIFLPLAAMLTLLGCGSGGSSGSSSGNSSGGSGDSGGPPSITAVNVSGPGFSQAGQCANFKATVSGSGNFNPSVQWYVNGVAGGNNTNGYISGTGLYCAPITLPSPNSVSIKAIAHGDSSKSGSVKTTIVNIQISPGGAQVYVNSTQQFTATVAGTNPALIWQVSGVTGGNSTVGTISTSGLYKAPAHVTNLAISVEAALAAVTSAFASADIFVSGLILISPQNPQVTYSMSQQFSGQVIGGNDTQINWRAGYGTMTSSGMYTATTPETPDTITAWTGDSRGTATVQVVGVTPVIKSVSPQPATVGDQITITGQNLNTVLTVVFSDPAGEPIPIKGTVLSGTSATVNVPQGAVTGKFYVQTAQGGLAPVSSNSLQFQRLARLRIRSPQNDLGAGESVTLQYASLGDSTPYTLKFTADQGTFSGSTYFAPASVTADSFAHIKACISGTQSCDKLILGLHPFRISPSVPLAPLGGALQLSDVGAGGVSWNLLSGGGLLSSGALYTAGTTYQAGGPALVAASSSTATERTSVGVTGAFPGLLNRIVDYVDQHTQPPPGTYTLGLAISGNRMYVSATNYLGSTNNSYYWIDIYDITDPLHPAWITAAESYSAAPLYSMGQYLYSYQVGDAAVPGYPDTITLYSIQSGVPVLQARTQMPQAWSIGNSGGVLTLAPFYGGQITQYDLTGGTIASSTYNLSLPSDANQFPIDASLRVGNRLFVSVETNDVLLGGYILTYDLSTSPPTLLGKVNARSLNFYASGNLLFGALGGMEIYDISSQLPVLEGYVEGINAHQLVGTQLLARTAQQGCEIVDVSNPQQPKVTSVLFDAVISGWGCGLGVLVGNYVYDQEGAGGIVTYDASIAGGPVVQGYLYGGPHLASADYDLMLSSNSLYAATTTFDGAVLDIYDLTTNPPNLAGEYVDGTQAGYAVQTISHYVYFGMSRNIGVIDVSQPSSPALVATVPVPTGSLARSNNTIYAGTANNSIVVLDASNPSAPVDVRTIPLTDLPLKLRVAGNLLLVADNAAGLLIYDISSPHSPVLLSKVQGFVYTADVVVQGTTAYVAADTDGLGIVDFSTPSSPVLLSKTRLSSIDPFDTANNPPNEALSLAVNNGIVYVGTLNDNGIVFGLDCSKPAAPRIVSIYAYNGGIEGFIGALVFNGNQLFVGETLGGVYPVAQVDMSQPFDAINQYFPPAALQYPSTVQNSAFARNKHHKTTLKQHSAAPPLSKFYRAR